jgi:molybdopterin-guanine dinucleotide biosynthesis protein A
MYSLALLSGGISSRMGQDKALMSFLGRPLILWILERLASRAEEVILSTNRPEDYAFLGLPFYTDIFPDCGALGGLHAALTAAKCPNVAVVACDMPFANAGLFDYESELLGNTGMDVVVPATSHGLEPLHAVYRRASCLPAIQASLEAGKFKMVGWLEQVNPRLLSPQEVAPFNQRGLTFWNLNTMDEFRQAEEQARHDKDYKAAT